MAAQDITDPDAPAALLRAAHTRYGQLHGLVSNAGVLRSGPLLQLADDDLTRHDLRVRPHCARGAAL